jgi:hypothetical protein
MTTATAEPKRKRKGKHGLKSRKIRAYYEQHPDDGPTAIARAVSATGTKVTPTLVSNVIARLPQAGKRSRGASGDRVAFSSLMEARKFAEQAGSIDEARRLLDMLSRIAR